MRTLLTAVIVAAALAGCSKSDGPDIDSTRPVAASAGRNDSTFRIALIAKSSTNPVFLGARNGAEAAAKELSEKNHMNIQIVWMTPPQEDGQVQAQRVQQAVNDGVDAILLTASDAGKVTGAINDAVDRGVPVMMFDSDAPQSKRFAFYGVDDVKTGQQTMAELAKLMNGKGKVAILAGNQNAPNLQKRVQGAKDEAAKHPGMQVIGVFNHVETGQDASAEVVRVDNAYPEIQGWCFIGGWPLFAQSLLTDAPFARLEVASVDALGAQLPYIEKGVVPVLLAQPVYNWGYVGVQTIVDHVHFKKDVPQIIPMDLVRVSKENLGDWARQLKSWGLEVDDKYTKM